MSQVQRWLSVVCCLLLAGPALADHHAKGPARRPNNGLLVPVGDQGHFVELLVQDAELVTLRVLDKNKKPVVSDASELVLTFTEPDGEVEDYKISTTKLAKGGQAFQRKSSHVVSHIVRDKMSIKVKAGGKELASKAFNFPFGPHGGDLAELGKSGLVAELLVQGEAVRVFVLSDRKRPKKVDAKEITLIFTEKNGSKEDYQIDVKTGTGKGTMFERVSGHVADHVKRDKVSIELDLDKRTHASKTFEYSGK